MPVILDPTAELEPIPRKLNPVVPAELRSIAMVDISKPKGSIFLDRLEYGLRSRFQEVQIVRYQKPTFAKPAPRDLRTEIARSNQFVVMALAD